jgi:hypothetical protein
MATPAARIPVIVLTPLRFDSDSSASAAPIATNPIIPPKLESPPKPKGRARSFPWLSSKVLPATPPSPLIAFA